MNQLTDFERIATVGGCPDLAEKLRGILEMYESSKKEAFLARGKRKTVILDEYGRSYTLGKRKTSSARVWMIPVQPPSNVEQSAEQLLGLPDAETQTFPVTISQILVNNLPLNQFFPIPADRERITRPLKVAGVLGKYNIFAIVRGGGTAGQAGALAHGISKGIVAHEPDLEVMFRRGIQHPDFITCTVLIDSYQLNSHGATHVWSKGRRPVLRRHANGFVAFLTHSFCHRC